MLILRKSEVSTEFITLVGFILIIFIVVLVIVGLKNKDVSESIAFAEAQRVSNLVANEINFAASIKGYYREFTLPTKLVNDIPYDIFIDTNFRFVEIKWDSKNAMSNIITENIYGTIKPGLNRIRNEGGMIILES